MTKIVIPKKRQYLMMMMLFIFSLNVTRAAIFQIKEEEKFVNENKLLVVYQLIPVEMKILAVEKKKNNIVLTLENTLKFQPPILCKAGDKVYSDLTLAAKTLMIRNIPAKQMDSLYQYFTKIVVPPAGQAIEK